MLVLEYSLRDKGVVKILLGREDVDPDKPENTGRTPLSCAAWRGDETVAKILLVRKEANPNLQDNSRQPRSFSWLAVDVREL